MPGRVFVTGGSGFVGQAVIDELVRRDYPVNALAHRGEVKSPAGGRVRTVKGDLFDPAALAEGLRGCEAVIHLVGIIAERRSRGVTYQRIHVEGTRRIVDATRVSGVRRYLHMSALGSRPDAVATYHRTKFEAESYVRASSLDWTIFRPSLIHGPRGEFMTMEAGWARGRRAPFLFMPYFGGGLLGRRDGGLIQPVYVRDVARAFADALENPATIGEVYLIGGPDAMSWPQMHHMVSQALTGKQRRARAVPAWYAKAIARAVPGALLPFNRDQVLMSQEDNVCDLAKLKDTFGWEPQRFKDALEGYKAEL
jgi:nucleoside-diphosphate-sugar epimerase